MSKSELIELMHKRTKLEQEIEDLILQLQPYNLKGFDQSLVDSEGFPRENLDFGELTCYKNIKRQLNERNNDYSALMKVIEENLYAFHALLKSDPEVMKDMEAFIPKNNNNRMVQEQPQKLQQQEQAQERVHEPGQEPMIPFVKLTEVTDASPSALAGLQVDDMIIQFGLIHMGNHNNLEGLSKFVRDNIGNQIDIIFMRKQSTLPSQEIQYNGEIYAKITVQLMPMQWGGAGVLGCRFKQM